MCQHSLNNEQKVTKSIYNILKVTQDEDDHATEDFLQFFVLEQREEEVLFNRIIDKIKLLGKGPQSLYYIDKEFEKNSNWQWQRIKKNQKNNFILYVFLQNSKILCANIYSSFSFICYFIFL